MKIARLYITVCILSVFVTFLKDANAQSTPSPVAGIFHVYGGSYSSISCSGVLIHPKWVLTTAFCARKFFLNQTILRFSLNSSSFGSLAVFHPPKTIIIHRDYEPKTYSNNIALIELYDPVINIEPVRPYFGEEKFANRNATVMGWFYATYSDQSTNMLLQRTLKIVDNNTCPIAESNEFCAVGGLFDDYYPECSIGLANPAFIGEGTGRRVIGLESLTSPCNPPNALFVRLSEQKEFINRYVPLDDEPDNLRGPFGLWNSFLGMTNILELQNPSSAPVNAIVNLLDSTGKIKTSITVKIEAENQFDVILNNLNGFTKDSYGLVQVSSNVSGRISYYRYNSKNKNTFDYSYNLPLREGTTGTSYVNFNTFQPSTNIAKAKNVVGNWLSIVNLDQTSNVFKVEKYSFDGRLLSQNDYIVGAKNRIDVEAGHVNPGPNNFGFLKITPANANLKYVSQLARYGANGNDFDFAFPLEGKTASYDTVYLPVNSGENDQTWLEIVNLSDAGRYNSLKLYSQAGELLYNNYIYNQPRSQTHFNASTYIKPGTIGIAEISPTVPNTPFMAQSMIYFTEGSGDISSMTGYRGLNSSSETLRGGYNLFLSMDGYLQLHNAASTSTTVDVFVNSTASSGSSFTEVLKPNESKSYYLNNRAFGTIKDSYGTVMIVPKNGQKVFATTARVKRINGSSIEYVNTGVLE